MPHFPLPQPNPNPQRGPTGPADSEGRVGRKEFLQLAADMKAYIRANPGTDQAKSTKFCLANLPHYLQWYGSIAELSLTGDAKTAVEKATNALRFINADTSYMAAVDADGQQLRDGVAIVGPSWDRNGEMTELGATDVYQFGFDAWVRDVRAGVGLVGANAQTGLL